MLDNCSQGTFNHNSLVENLDMEGVKTADTVKTMMGEETEESICFSNLTVSSCSPSYKEKILFPRPTAQQRYRLKEVIFLIPRCCTSGHI